MTAFLWTVRFASALGLLSLTLTQEISSFYLTLSWSAWGMSFLLDRTPEWGERVRVWENAAVAVLVTVFLLDLFQWGSSIFISVAHFLLLFQIFKLIGLKTRKDCLQILVFSFFQMLSACTLSVDVWQAIILFLLIPTAAAGLFWQQVSREMETTGQPIPATARVPFRRLALAICLAAIPINILLASALFMIFPRLAFRGAFAGLGGGRSGYTEQVDLAQTGVLNMDNTAVLWLQISPSENRSAWNGYLRGRTLDVFDGQAWSADRAGTLQTLYPDTNGLFKVAGHSGHHKGLRQTVTLVHAGGTTLYGSPFIGEIVAPLATLQVLADGSVRWTSGWRKPLRYDVLSFDQPILHPRGLQAASLEKYLKLPALPLKRTTVLARQIAGRRAPFARAQAIEQYLRSRYSYSLDRGDRATSNPVEDFLFVRRRGPCGHFASAMAVMLRLQGIPARVVAGYYKGTWNTRINQYLIRERDAHAWVEAYFPERGWVLFDPSPRDMAVPSAQRWILRARENWEFLNYQWDRLVIEYDLYSQVKVIADIQSNTNRMNASIGGWVDKYLMGKRQATSNLKPLSAKIFELFHWRFAAPVAILIAVWIISRLRKRAAGFDPAIAFYQKFLNHMARKGFPKTAAETAWEYAERLSRQIGPEPAMDVTRRYYLTRFRPR